MLYGNRYSISFFLAYSLWEMRTTEFKIGDLVSRKSHNHDMVFKIIHIHASTVYLKGMDYRLYADANMNDLELVSNFQEDDSDIIERSLKDIQIDRDQYFYLPGNILHIDGDQEYLDRCMNYYNSMGIKANGIMLQEKDISSSIISLLSEYHPDIVVITGHDSYKNKQYENSQYFVSAIKEARKYEHNQDKLIIIAGACQSNYESLIRAGANFASSPKRINIHALDPAIIASSLAFSKRNQSIDLMSVIGKTKYGSDGIGGLITNGTMYVGYPR